NDACLVLSCLSLLFVCLVLFVLLVLSCNGCRCYVVRFGAGVTFLPSVMRCDFAYFLVERRVIEVEISSWRGARVGVRTYLLGGAIDGSEANGIIRDPKLELESSRFTFDLVPLSYESVDVNVGGIGTWRKRNLKRIRGLVEYKEDELTYVIYLYKEEANLDLWEGIKMGMRPILALPEGADDFVVYYDARSKDLEACLEKKGEGDCLLTNRWLSMKKDIASCGSKYLAYSEVEVEYQGSSRLLLNRRQLVDFRGIETHFSKMSCPMVGIIIRYGVLHLNDGMERNVVNQQQQQPEFPQLDLGLTVLVFKQGNDPIDAINHMMSILSAVVTSRYPITNNQLRNSSNPRKQATINDGRVTLQPVQRRQISFVTGTREGRMSKQCTKHNRKRDDSWFKDKVLLVQAQANGQILHEEELAFLADPGTAEVALMVNLSHYGLDALAEVHNPDNVDNNMINQGVQVTPFSKQSNVVNHSEIEITSDNNIILYSHVNDTLTAELERYKEQVKVLKEGQNIDLKNKDNISDSSTQSVEIDHLKQTFSKHLKEKESLMQTVTLLKNDFKKEESRNINREIALEKRIKQLDNIKAQQLEPKLYDGNIIKNMSSIVIPDSEETLMLAEESRSKMLLKQKDPMMLEKKVNTTPVDYAVLNQLSQDFEKRFVPQIELSAEQAFWSKNSMNSPESTLSSRPTKVEVPKELPKVNMVNMSLKKLKYHLAGFDVVVKERTIPTAITEGSWGFKHTKACFRDEIIPFVKALKDLFNTFDQYLIDELSECLKLETELLNKKDFVEKGIYDKLFRNFTTLEKHCISLEVDTQLNQEIFQRDNSVSNQSAPSFDQFFELNEWKAQSQEKYTVIKKLKERIKSLSENMNEDKVKKDIRDIETIILNWSIGFPNLLLRL
ncbi:hypothetical protein Tco_0505565, partial [Tanacetum coccineum]